MADAGRTRQQHHPRVRSSSQTEPRGVLPLVVEEQASVDFAKTPEQIKREALFSKVITYLDPEDRSKDPFTLSPASKLDSIWFYAMMSHGETPAPYVPTWIQLGFCACSDRGEASKLAIMYRRLIFGHRFDEQWKIFVNGIAADPGACTFAEFEAAYAAGTLAALLRSKVDPRPRAEQAILTRLDRFFPTRNRPVWNFKAFLANTDEAKVPPHLLEASVLYGFTGSQTVQEKTDLKEFYKELLRKVDPLELEDARVQGRLVAFTKSKTKIESRFEAWMKGCQ